LRQKTLALRSFHNSQQTSIINDWRASAELRAWTQPRSTTRRWSCKPTNQFLTGHVQQPKQRFCPKARVYIDIGWRYADCSHHVHNRANKLSD
jgi:hypothetical protein